MQAECGLSFIARVTRLFLATLCAATFPSATALGQEREPVTVTCQFDGQPLMTLVYRGGMGADDNTLQVGEDAPVKLAVGSSLSSATVGELTYVFSLREPANVTIGNSTFGGTCASTLAAPAPLPVAARPTTPVQPFGILPGAPLATLQVLAEVEPYFEMVEVTRPHPEFISYAVLVTPAAGVCSVTAIGRSYDNDRYGTGARGAFSRLLAQLESQYGHGEVSDYIRPGALWDDGPDEWVMAIRQHERELRADWSGAALPVGLASIVLSVLAQSSNEAYLALAYTFENEPECRAEIARAGAGVL